MGYSSIASSIRNKVKSVDTALSSVKGISFTGVWSGDAYNTQSSNLNDSLNNISAQRDLAIKLADALDKLQQYKDNKEKIESLQSQLNSLANTEENASLISSLRNQISQLQSANNTLRSDIGAIVSGFSSVSTKYEEVKYEANTDYMDYVVDLADMLTLFNSGSLTKIPDSGKNSLYDYYSEEEVDAKLNEIRSKYSGREAAVNCALGIMEMAASVGLKLDYDWGGGHTTVTDVDHVATGTDCSAFASWAINQGASSTFNTKTTAGLINVGTQVSYEDAQKGDILVYNSGGNGHVVMIVDNDPDTQQFLVVEASGSNSGVIMQTRSYASLSGTYQARDLSSIYNN
ncbi:MAG: NlpC/P60 family protein [Candidatus Coprovivens sp.]